MGEGIETEGDLREEEGEGEEGEEEVEGTGEIGHVVERERNLRRKDRLFLDYHGFLGNDIDLKRFGVDP